MHIREAHREDSVAIGELLASLDYPDTERFIQSKIDQQRVHPDAKLLVAVEETHVIGFISLHFIPQIALARDFCRISYFCVADAYRGKGVGAALEEKGTAIAIARGCDRIEVHCHSRRRAAHRFYNRQGYSESPKYLIKSLK